MNKGGEATWLKLLPLELQSIEEKDFQEPPDEMETDCKTEHGDEVHPAGEMSFEERRLYTLWKTVEKQAYQLALDARFRKPDDTGMRKIHEIHAKADTLEGVFWITLRDGHDLWQPCSVGLRRGWLVVWYVPKHEGPQIFGLGPFRFGPQE